MWPFTAPVAKPPLDGAKRGLSNNINNSNLNLPNSFRHYKLRRDEMPNSKYLLCLKYLEEAMEEKGILPAFDI